VIPNRLVALRICSEVLVYFHRVRRESILVAYLDSGNICMNVEVRFGGPTSVRFPTDEIIGIAERIGASKILVAHNHPDDRPTPSDADVQHAAALWSTAEASNVKVVDDIVWCHGGVKSVLNTQRFKSLLRTY